MTEATTLPTKSDSVTALTKHTGSLIRRAQQRHLAIWLAEVSSEVTSVQYAALAALHERPDISQRQLGDALDVDRSTIADLVARMVRNGLIARMNDPADRRGYIVSLTPAGRLQLATLKPRVDAVEHILTAALTQHEVSELTRMLSLLLSDRAL